MILQPTKSINHFSLVLVKCFHKPVFYPEKGKFNPLCSLLNMKKFHDLVLLLLKKFSNF